MEPTRDIGRLASLARTALDDPGSVDWLASPVGIPFDIEQDGAEGVATQLLDIIIAITDPLDDEREAERSADSLDVLGGHIERIRESLTSEHGPILGESQARDADEAEMQAELSDVLASALDKVDHAVAWLRAFADRREDEPYECEDCAVNGDDCRTHGEAFKLATRAIHENPERVVALLTRED